MSDEHRRKNNIPGTYVQRNVIQNDILSLYSLHIGQIKIIESELT